MPQTSDAADAWRRALLLDAYKLERAEVASQTGVQATLAALSLASIGALTTLLVQTCTVGCTTEPAKRAPDVLLAGIPLLPSALLAFLAVSFLRTVVRSYYARAIERELAATLTKQDRLKAYRGLSIPRGVELALSVSPTALRRTGAARVLGALLVAVLLIGYVGLVALIAATVSWPWRVTVLVLYGTVLALILRLVWRAAIDGRRYFSDATVEMRKALKRTLTPDGTQDPRAVPGLVAYLLMPRPDSLPKLLVPVTTFAVMTAVLGSGGTSWGTALLGIGIVELLVAQARYQLNDIRGLREDQRDSQSGVRRRLPVVPGRARESVQASLRAVAVRLVVAVCAVLFLPAGAMVVTILTGLVVLTLWWFYEAVRSRGPRTLGRVLLPLALGYAVRGGLGVALYLVGPSAEGWLLATGLVVSATAFGVMFVTMTWTLHAVASGAQPSRIHFEPLLRVLPAGLWDGLTPGEYADVRPLRGAQRLRAPWSVALLVATAAGAAVVGAGIDLAAVGVAWAAVVGVLVGALLLVVRRGRTVLAAAVALAALWVPGADADGSSTAAAAGLPLAGAVLVHAWLSASSYRDLKSSAQRLALRVRNLREGGRGALLGDDTRDYLAEDAARAAQVAVPLTPGHVPRHRSRPGPGAEPGP